MRDTCAAWGRSLTLAVGVGMIAAGGCTDAVKNTELRPEGPPEVLQVLVHERAGGGTEPRMAFGEHPDVDPTVDDHDVTDAVAGDGQRIRFVVDELLLGNALEQVLCADDTWSDVAVGSEREDIARCAGSDLSKCTAVCVGVGIMDANGDRSIDATQLIDGIASLSCDGVNVPANIEQSYYQPSGNQLVPAGPLGLEGLGPALVIVPSAPLPTGARCGIELSGAVVDRDGIQPCAAAGGRCEPGDLSAIDFGVEPLLALASEPRDGSEGVAPSAESATATFHMNVPVDLANAAVTATAGGTAVAATVAASEEDPSVVVVTLPDGLAAATAYAVTVSDVVDLYGGGLVEPLAVTWTTGEE